MVSKSLRMNASSSPRGSEEPVSPKMERTASASPESSALPREFRRSVKRLTNLQLKDSKPEKYIHVHHFKNTKLFGAWFNDPSKPGKKMRLFFGSHLTAYLAARAQDRAALKYKPYALDPRSIKLNFKEEDYVADQKLRDMLTCEEFGELLRKESRPKYTKMEPTPCLRKFLAHERARGNIPSAVPPKDEDVIPLRQYLKEVIRKREQPDEDIEDSVPTNEESSEDQGSSDEEIEDAVPSAEQTKHASKVERQTRSEGKRIVIFTERRTRRRSPVAGPSECKPLVNVSTPLPVWGRTRKRSKRQEYIDDDISEYSSEEEEEDYPLSPKVETELKYLATARNKLHNEKSREPAPQIEPEGLPTEVENTKTPEPGTEGPPESPEFPELQFRSKWHYKMHRIQKLQNSRTSAEILRAEVENTKTPVPAAATETNILPGEVENTKTSEPGTEGSPESPEFPELQFRSKWYYKMHKIQKLQTSSTSEPPSEPSPKTDEGSYLEALATALLSAAEKLQLAGLSV